MLIITKSAAETKKFAQRIAKNILRMLPDRTPAGAVVVSLEGNLGAGKTTFTQGFGKVLGVKEKMSSPTFVVMKKYSMQRLPRRPSRISADGVLLAMTSLYHIDCYRFEKPEELLALGFKDILGDPTAIVLIEWGDRIRRIMPTDRIILRFSHGGGTRRYITVSGLPNISGLRASSKYVRRCT